MTTGNTSDEDRDDLFIWTIYRRGDTYVARRFKVLATGPELMEDEISSGNIEILRNLFRDKYHLYPLGRQPDDEIDIVESWI